jgi:hypothetical protein
MRLAVVKEYTDRTGKMRRYFRKRGCKTVALPGAPGPADFMLTDQSAMGGKSTQPVATATPIAGTVAALIIDHQRSPSFASNLEPSSHKAYRKILDQFRDQHGHRLACGYAAGQGGGLDRRRTSGAWALTTRCARAQPRSARGLRHLGRGQAPEG